MKKTEWVRPDKPPKEITDPMNVKVLIGDNPGDITECFAQSCKKEDDGYMLEYVLVRTGGHGGPDRVTFVPWLKTTRPIIVVPICKEVEDA